MKRKQRPGRTTNRKRAKGSKFPDLCTLVQDASAASGTKAKRIEHVRKIMGSSLVRNSQVSCGRRRSLRDMIERPVRRPKLDLTTQVQSSSKTTKDQDVYLMLASLQNPGECYELLYSANHVLGILRSQKKAPGDLRKKVHKTLVEVMKGSVTGEAKVKSHFKENADAIAKSAIRTGKDATQYVEMLELAVLWGANGQEDFETTMEVVMGSMYYNGKAQAQEFLKNLLGRWSGVAVGVGGTLAAALAWVTLPGWSAAALTARVLRIPVIRTAMMISLGILQLLMCLCAGAMSLAESATTKLTKVAVAALARLGLGKWFRGVAKWVTQKMRSTTMSVRDRIESCLKYMFGAHARRAAKGAGKWGSRVLEILGHIYRKVLSPVWAVIRRGATGVSRRVRDSPHVTNTLRVVRILVGLDAGFRVGDSVMTTVKNQKKEVRAKVLGVLGDGNYTVESNAFTGRRVRKYKGNQLRLMPEGAGGAAEYVAMMVARSTQTAAKAGMRSIVRLAKWLLILLAGDRKISVSKSLEGWDQEADRMLKDLWKKRVTENQIIVFLRKLPTAMYRDYVDDGMLPVLSAVCFIWRHFLRCPLGAFFEGDNWQPGCCKDILATQF